MAKKIMTVEDMKDREKWLQVRNMGIGGSDAGVIAGVNQWKSSFQLWREKTGQVEAEDLSNNEYVYWGTVLEKVVADEFCRQTGKKVRKCGTLQDDEYDFILANVDRMVDGENAGLECKTANGFAAKKWEGDEVPDTYFLQCQHYMMVTGCERWYIACLIGGNHFVWKTIERNDDDINALREAEVSWWQKYVVSGEMPQVDGSDACTQALVEKFSNTKSEAITFDKDQSELVEEVINMETTAKALKAEIDAKKNQIRELMGENEIAYSNEHKLTWKPQKGRTTIDAKKLQANYPDAYAACSKTGNPTRVLKFY